MTLIEAIEAAKLSPAENRVVQFLLDRGDSLQGHEDVAKWCGLAGSVNTKTLISVYVTMARKKLAPFGVVIRTVRGVYGGYGKVEFA